MSETSLFSRRCGGIFSGYCSGERVSTWSCDVAAARQDLITVSPPRFRCVLMCDVSVCCVWLQDAHHDPEDLVGEDDSMPVCAVSPPHILGFMYLITHSGGSRLCLEVSVSPAWHLVGFSCKHSERSVCTDNTVTLWTQWWQLSSCVCVCVCVSYNNAVMSSTCCYWRVCDLACVFVFVFLCDTLAELQLQVAQKLSFFFLFFFLMILSTVWENWRLLLQDNCWSESEA